MSETARPVTDLRPDVPPALANLITRCMAKDSAERPQNADELLASLETTPTSDAAQPAMPATKTARRAYERDGAPGDGSSTGCAAGARESDHALHGEGFCRASAERRRAAGVARDDADQRRRAAGDACHKNCSPRI